MATKEELINRWDDFLHKIETRFHQSLQQAEEACIHQLKETDYDYYTVYRSWQGMKSQIQQLPRKIDETWDNAVEPQMRALGDFWMEENHKGSHLEERLYKDMETFERLLEGELSQLFYNHANKTSNKDFSCTQCQASLEVKKNLFRAHYITCPYCQAVNTFEPDTKYLQIGWNVIDNIAALKTEETRRTMQQALDELQEVRPPAPDRMWEKYRQAYLSYWEAFFKEKAKMDVTAEERYDKDMQRKQLEYTEYENTYRYNKYGVE